MRHPCNNSLLVALLALLSLTEVHGKEQIHYEKLIYELSGDRASVVGWADSTYSQLIIPQTIVWDGKSFITTSIADNAFIRCRNLNSVVLPESIRRIGSLAFAFCTDLHEIIIPSTIDTICTDAFYRCDGLPIEGGIHYAGCFLANVSDCDAQHLVIREGCRFIGDNAFSECHKLISVKIPESVKVIGNFAFAGCNSLKQLYIPESVETIGSSAFAMCSVLEIIHLPANVQSYSFDLLIDCNSLKELYITSEYPPSIMDFVGTHNPAIDNFHRFNPERCVLYVPRDSRKLYRDSSGWRSFKKIKVLK